MRHIVMIAVMSLTSMNCAGDSSSPPSDLTEVSGVYSGGFEASFLGPCGSAETWWVRSSPDFHRRYAALGLPAYGNAFVRAEGHLSGPGHYGHMGLACREFSALEVRELRPATVEDCETIAR